MKTGIAVAIVAASTIFGAAIAAEPEAFKAADADADGFVTAAEAETVQGLPGQFSDVDTNEDGRLDEAEFAQFEVKETSN